MILSTFIHIRGIGPKRERKLWNAGIKTWQAAINSDKKLLESIVASESVDDFIYELTSDFKLYQTKNIGALAGKLDSSEHWRILDSFPEYALYLDIETGVDSAGFSSVTVIGTYTLDSGYKPFIDGKNIELFPEFFSLFPILVTFNGSAFDFPVLRQNFRNLHVPVIHIDLMWIGRRVGIRGSLKKIERMFGITRDKDVEGLTGWDAVKLWQLWMERKDHEILSRIIRYNRCDTVNLEVIGRKMIGLMKKKIGF